MVDLIILARYKDTFRQALAKELEGGESQVTHRRIEMKMCRRGDAELPVELSWERRSELAPLRRPEVAPPCPIVG